MAATAGQHWRNVEGITFHRYTCSYCDSEVAPHAGYTTNGFLMRVLICPNCNNPTYIDGDSLQFPRPGGGEPVLHITDIHVESAYKEARACMSVGAYTAATLICRKILMNFAVSQGADPGKNFVTYVNYISDNHYVPPQGKKWIDPIRDKGNDATHEIPEINEVDAKRILTFTMMLLKNNYELAAIAEEFTSTEKKSG